MELDLRESDVEVRSKNWLFSFPETYTSLVSLNISCLEFEVNFSALDRLVSRCPNLRTLKLNRGVPLEKLSNLLKKAPQLIELGAGTSVADLQSDVFSKLAGAFSACKKLKGLSGFWDVVPSYLPAVYPVCSGLTTLNLSYATIESSELIDLLGQCPKLQRLWVSVIVNDES